jgi:hypothetical protein
MPMPARRRTEAGVVADTPKTKTKNEWMSWKNRRYDSSRSDETQRRTELWRAFNDFVRENRGWITSPPGSRVAIFETEVGSTLPQKLVKLGYAISELPGDHSRITGAGPSLQEETLKRQGYAIDVPGPTIPVDRFEIVLPWAAPPPPAMRRRVGG